MKHIVSKKSIVHYLLIYILVAFQGSNIYRLYDSMFMIVAIVCFGCCILKRGIKRVETSYFCWMALICSLILANLFYTHGSTSIGTVGNFLSRFCIVAVAITYDSYEFKNRLIKLVAFLAKISVFTFGLTLIFGRNIFNFLPLWSFSGAAYRGGIFFSIPVMNFSAGRNVGIFGEPGVYQIVLNAVLLVLLFEDNLNLSAKEKKTAIIYILLALVTAQSTTGLLGTLIVLVAYVLSKKTEEVNNWLRRMLIVGLCLFVVIVFFGGSESFIYNNFTNKLFSDSGSIDLSASTGKYRIISMETDRQIFKSAPLGVGTVQYKIEWARYVSGWTNTKGSVVGLTFMLATYGWPVTLCSILFLLWGGWRNKSSKMHYLAMIGIIVVTIFSQPKVLYPIYMAMAYPILNKESANEY